MTTIRELLSDPEQAAKTMREALARGLTLKRYLKVQSRNGSGVRYYKPAPTHRDELLAKKAKAQGWGDPVPADAITPPPAAMVEAKKRRES